MPEGCDTIYRRAELHATGRKLVLGGLLWLVSAAGVIALQARVAALTGGRPVPDVLPFYTPQQLSALLDQYGEAGRRAFLQFTLYDLLYPFVAYGFALLVLAWLVRPFVRVDPRWAYVALVPVVGLAVELLEQIGFLLALFLLRDGSGAWWPLAAVSAAKLIVLGALAVGLLALGVARVALRLRRPASR
jgi:hypothetical protein